MLHETLITPGPGLRVSLVAAAPLLAGLLLSSPAIAQAPSLDGSWSGSGQVRFASGDRESARCRAQYSRMSAGSYALRATCATGSGRASQTATLRYVGGNRYEGTFYNSEYDVRGTIHVAVGGNRQTVRLSSDAGSASFELRR
jgi:hypothetical protein